MATGQYITKCNFKQQKEICPVFFNLYTSHTSHISFLISFFLPVSVQLLPLLSWLAIESLLIVEEIVPWLLIQLGGLQLIGPKTASFPISNTPEGAFSGAKGQSAEARRSAKPWPEINHQCSQAHDCGAQGESTSH